MDFQGYGLRDNPKKSWKFLGFTDAAAAAHGDDDDDGDTCSMLKFQCKACAKEFASMKSLFGHMSHHSGREKKGIYCQECGKKFQSLKARACHMKLLHSEKLRVSGELGSGADGGLRQDNLVLETITAVRRKRSKRLRNNNNNSAANSSLSSLNESFSAGAVEMDQELEDAASCLIMMSVGVRNWGEFNSFCDKDDETFQMKKPRANKSDSDVSASSSSMNQKIEFRVFKVDDDESEIEERISGETMNFSSVEVESTSKDAVFDEEPQKKNNKYKCRICSKTFKSHYALGGHQTIHRKSSSSSSCAVDEIENRGGESITQNSKLVKIEYVEKEMKNNGVTTSYGTRVNKVHRCGICLKSFASGQALGGHKRSHILKNSETNVNNHQSESDAIDLNLPFTRGEEGNGDIGFKSCWIGSDSKSEAQLSLVAN